MLPLLHVNDQRTIIERTILKQLVISQLTTEYFYIFNVSDKLLLFQREVVVPRHRKFNCFL